jgi:hypothetical protein
MADPTPFPNSHRTPEEREQDRWVVAFCATAAEAAFELFAAEMKNGFKEERPE